MVRLCERPGCSDPASVAYGMQPEELVFWLQAITDDDQPESGLLCRRHADSMVVPRGWTLDDRRDPDLHLFRPPEPDVPPATALAGRRRRQAGRRPDDTSEQLVLDEARIVAPSAEPAAAPGAETAPSPADAHEPWMPDFDHGDDLDGLLAARTPLLARAFRGDDRPR